jgi:DNA-binding Xre family transcriptional regulator
VITKLRARILETYGPLNQNHLADELNINRARMSRYATGTIKIPAHHLLRLSIAMQCSPKDLLGYTEMEDL